MVFEQPVKGGGERGNGRDDANGQGDEEGACLLYTSPSPRD
mgnify:CR=1 FL=1